MNSRNQIGLGLLRLLGMIAYSVNPNCFCAGQDSAPTPGVKLVVLGIAQDAGFPQAGCAQRCCKAAWQDPSLRRFVSCLAVVDQQHQTRWLLDCTPDFPQQLHMLNEVLPVAATQELDGIFLTHAHVGHYAGLIHLGREAMGANKVPVYALPRMSQFLTANGPWSLLVELENIRLQPLADAKAVAFDRVTITPFLVPHRDEFSETVGFLITGPNRKVIFLPDIDKWSRWDDSIEELVGKADVAYLDGTFFANGEIPGRDMSLIPHPFVSETIERFSPLDKVQRDKIRFIHLNHTNPCLQTDSAAALQIERAGMHIAVQGEVIEL